MLTDAKCRNAKPKEKSFKLTDGGGLFLQVLPTGAKSWRFSFRFGGKTKLLVIGLYPIVSLSDARRARDDAKRLLTQGVDPAEQKRLEKLTRSVRAVTTFGAVAEEFLAREERAGKAKPTVDKKRWMLMSLARPLAGRPIAEITAPELLAVLRKVEGREIHESTKRLRAVCGQLFRYAIATGRAERDPSADLKGALISPTVTHRAAITQPAEIGALWRAVSSYTGQPETRLALKLALLTAARPGEVRMAEWSEFDLEAQEWRVPAARTKMRREWRVPLSAQAMSVLRDLQPLTGRGKYLFPSVRTVSRPMSDGAFTAALRRMGFTKDEVTAHGFRGTFSTYANESRLWDHDVIEAALAHQDKNAVRRAYNRAEHSEERARLAQWWADELDRLAYGEEGKIIELKTAPKRL